MSGFSYNQVTDNNINANPEDRISFENWCIKHGIEILNGWDAGMYGNIYYKVRKDGVVYLATGYQSTGMCQNFTFRLNLNDVAENDKPHCKKLIKS